LYASPANREDERIAARGFAWALLKLLMGRGWHLACSRVLIDRWKVILFEGQTVNQLAAWGPVMLQTD
jgi:hypothetical protein